MKWSYLFVVVFLREGDFSGIRIDEIIRNRQPMEQITIRKVEVSDKGLIRTVSKIRTATLFLSYFNYKNQFKLTKQTVKILMRQLIESRLIRISNVCKGTSEV